MDVHEFLGEFAEAIRAKSTEPDSRALSRTRRLVNSAIEAMSSTPSPISSRIVEKLTEVDEELDRAGSAGVPLKDFVEKGEAMLKLEGLIDDEQLMQVKDLIREAKPLFERRSAREIELLPVHVIVICEACDKTILGSRSGGIDNPARIRQRVVGHARRFHNELTPEERMNLRDVLRNLEGQAEQRFGHFRLVAEPRDDA